jgi:hypothetical protein
VNGLSVHSLRATAATNALSHEADIVQVRDGSARQCVDDAPLRPAQDAPGGQPDVPVRYWSTLVSQSLCRGLVNKRMRW